VKVFIVNENFCGNSNVTTLKLEGLTEHEKSVGLCAPDSHPKKLADEASSQHRSEFIPVYQIYTPRGRSL